MNKNFKLELIIYLIIIVILIIWFGYYQVKLIQRGKEIEQIEIKYNEITTEFENLRSQYINEVE